MKENIHQHNFSLKREDFLKKNKMEKEERILWFFGPSGAGKSTLANEVQRRYFKEDRPLKILDGDDLRSGLCSDLGFSIEERSENMRRAAEVAKLFHEMALGPLCCFVTPLKIHRDIVRSILKERVLFFYIAATLEDCFERDPKQLYARAKNNEIKDFTSLSSPFEEPNLEEESDCYKIDTSKKNISSCVEEVFSLLRSTLIHDKTQSTL